METLRKRFSQDPSYIDESAMGLHTSEANPTGRAGHIPGCPVGTIFSSRLACANARVHGKTVAGIHGTTKYGAYSICLSGGYVDDLDEGDFIIYTGTGGKNDGFGASATQTGDQSFDHIDNAALAKSAATGRPVRVIRGSNENSAYAPPAGYRYDGLYTVTRAYYDKGKDGHQICRFELERVPGQEPIPHK